MNFDNASSSDDDDDDEEPQVVSRAEWHARPARRVTELLEPHTNIVYSETETKSCSTKAECVQIIQEIQNYHLDVKGLPDIQYHFMVGGDGNIYEGRGWNYAGVMSPEDHRFSQGTTGPVLEIAFVGDFTDKAPSKEMLKIASRLLVHGLKTNKIIIVEKSKSDTLTEQDVERLKQEGYNVKIFEPELIKNPETEEKEEKEGKEKDV